MKTPHDIVSRFKPEKTKKSSFKTKSRKSTAYKKKYLNKILLCNSRYFSKNKQTP